MSKHIIDQPRRQNGGRLRAFTRQERESGLHPAIETLRSRPKTRGEENCKAAQFLRIEREHRV